MQGLDHVIFVTAQERKIYFRQYTIKFKKSGTKVTSYPHLQHSRAHCQGCLECNWSNTCTGSLGQPKRHALCLRDFDTCHCKTSTIQEIPTQKAIARQSIKCTHVRSVQKEKIDENEGEIIEPAQNDDGMRAPRMMDWSVAKFAGPDAEFSVGADTQG